MAIWIKQGAYDDTKLLKQDIPKDLIKIISHIGMGIFIVCFGSSAITAIIVTVLGKLFDNLFVGFLTGLFLFGSLGYYFLFKKDKPFYLILKPLFISD